MWFSRVSLCPCDNVSWRSRTFHSEIIPDSNILFNVIVSSVAFWCGGEILPLPSFTLDASYIQVRPSGAE